MKKMSPLKRNCATHLMMELAQCKCACISDTLFYEFWRDIDVSRLEVFNLVSPNSLMQLLHDILNAMFNLLEWRNLELCHSTFSAMFPLVFGAFGDWAQDVIDIVEHADCERRLGSLYSHSASFVGPSFLTDCRKCRGIWAIQR
ncbi:uncharacterized protein LOC131315682 isoform X2 [Rhododendron vialii]|nr:uncharacterized protein LOC131315682 isoform X2 [Rhododendron vialii]